MNKKFILFLGTLAFSATGFAMDKNWVARHMRAMLGLDTRQQITVGEPVPSEISGLLTVPITINGGNYPIYMSVDEKRYLWGSLNDLAVDPDKAHMEKISLANVHSVGSSSAPITLVEFTDLECPYCSQAHQSLTKDLYTKYTKGQVRWVFKHFPLSGHLWAEPAAVASECAAMQKEAAFWKMTDKFYVYQSSTTKDNVGDLSLRYAKELKLDVDKFKACLSGGDALVRVRSNRDEGTKLGVGSTPTIYVNGRLRRGFNTFEDIKVVIDEKLEELKKK